MDEKEMMTSPPKEMTASAGMNRMLFITTTAVALGSAFPTGFSLSVLNAPQLIIQRFCNESIVQKYDYYMSPAELNFLWAAVVSLYVAGGMIGAAVAGYFLNMMGRKRSILFNQLFACGAAILFASCKPAKSVEMLMIGRVFIGFFSGFTCSAVPVYLTEIAPPNLRGSLGVVQPMGMNIGILFAQILGVKFILGNEEGWPFLITLYMIPVVLFTVVLHFCPESPKFLYVIREEPDAALHELSRLRGVPHTQLQADVMELREDAKLRQAETPWSYRRLFTAPEIRLALLLACAMQGGQQLSGINAVFFYSTSIFLNSGLSVEHSQYATIGAGVINCVMAILAMGLVSRWGRRRLMTISLSGVVLCLFILFISLILQNTVQWMSYVAVVALLSYVLTYGVGLGPIPFFIGSELFQQGPKPAAMSLACWANWACNFLVGMSFPPLQTLIGEYCFLGFIFSSILLFVFLHKKLPETKDQDPTEVAKILKQQFLENHITESGIVNLEGGDAYLLPEKV